MRTYKEVLLTPTAHPRRGAHCPQHPPASPFAYSRPRRVQQRQPSALQGRCFRCLAKDHRVYQCRDPLRCARCFKTGHLARNCRSRPSHRPTRMHRALHFRPASRKVFVPLTEGYHARQQQCQNAVLANILRSANLGHFPQDTVATDLALYFGGFSNDFLVASHSERDFIIFLPAWVQASELVRRGVINLSHCRLRCYSWNQYRDATASRLSYKAWVQLVDLSFECWSEANVAAIVNSFGRYLRDDDKSINMQDLIGFRCQIAADDLAEIPENLAVTLGDLVLNVIVQFESSAPFGGDDRSIPFVGGDQNEGEGQTDPLGRRIARRVDNRGRTLGGGDSREGDAPGHGSASADRTPLWRETEDGLPNRTFTPIDDGARPPPPPLPEFSGGNSTARFVDRKSRGALRMAATGPPRWRCNGYRH